MKKIFVLYLGRKGAGPVYSCEMTKGLIENDLDVYAMIPKTIDNLSKWRELPLKELYLVDTYSGNLSFLLKTLSFFFWKRAKLKKQLKELNVDACYIPMLQPWTGLILPLLNYKTMIATIHDPSPHRGDNNVISHFLNERVIKSADEIVILSESFRNYICEHYSKKHKNVHVIPHGNFNFYKNIHSTDLILERNSKINFLFFGRVSEYKGLPILAEAYARLFKIVPDISLYVVGAGDFSAYRKLFPSEYNITIVNDFIPDKDVAMYFRGKRVVTVLPYIDASQSGVIPIAMAFRSLLIVTKTGGLYEQVGYGKYAVCVNPTIEDLFSKMKDVVERYDSYLTYINEAEKYVNSLSWEVLAKKIKDIVGNDNKSISSNS